MVAKFTARPDKEVLARPDLLAEWEQEEIDREERARENAGTYYPHTALQSAYEGLSNEQAESAALRARIDDLQGQLDAIRNDPLVSRLTRLRASQAFRALRDNAVARRLYGPAGR